MVIHFGGDQLDQITKLVLKPTRRLSLTEVEIKLQGENQCDGSSRAFSTSALHWRLAFLDFKNHEALQSSDLLLR